MYLIGHVFQVLSILESQRLREPFLHCIPIDIAGQRLNYVETRNGFFFVHGRGENKLIWPMCVSEIWIICHHCMVFWVAETLDLEREFVRSKAKKTSSL